MVLACKGRRFFITQNNFFVFSSKDIQAGDEIHALSGTYVPFALRRVQLEDYGAGDHPKENDLQAHQLGWSCIE
jgi:hypothetical protein